MHITHGLAESISFEGAKSSNIKRSDVGGRNIMCDDGKVSHHTLSIQQACGINSQPRSGVLDHLQPLVVDVPRGIQSSGTTFAPVDPTSRLGS
jgi:hypothetical protein